MGGFGCLGGGRMTCGCGCVCGGGCLCVDMCVGVWGVCGDVGVGVWRRVSVCWTCVCGVTVDVGVVHPKRRRGTRRQQEKGTHAHTATQDPHKAQDTQGALVGGWVGARWDESVKWDESVQSGTSVQMGRECPKWDESVQSGKRVSKVGRECPKWDESVQSGTRASPGRPGSAWSRPHRALGHGDGRARVGGGRRKRKREREGQKKKKQTKHTHPKKSTITSYFFFIKHPFLYCEAAGVSGLRVGVCCQAGRHTSLHMASLALKAARLGAWLPRQSCGRSAGSGVVCVGHSPNPGLVCSIPSYYWGDCAKKHAHIKNTSFEFLYLPK